MNLIIIKKFILYSFSRRYFWDRIKLSFNKSTKVLSKQKKATVNRNRVKISAKDLENVVVIPSQRIQIQMENKRAQVSGNHSILVGIGNRGANFANEMPEVC